MKFVMKKGLTSSVPFCLKGKSTPCFRLFPKVKPGYGPGNAPVYLNVYDLTPMNGYAYWAGFGIFHSGVEVHGVEYAFGAHDYPSSGVFEVEPRQCPGFKFRRSILIGTTCLDPIQGSKSQGSVFSCVLPEALRVSAVEHDPNCIPYENEKQTLRSGSFSFLSSRQRQLSMSSLLLQSPLKGCLRPWELRRSRTVVLNNR
ncbi:protein of unknown function DUF862, eukaryotic [Cynara cardunculus var. scolymus]|uniref:PPPDE domain-containing protein n=1 Tax=Cynara cardunculus var. scolymus TaxID=59895 RepID=A0A118K3V0_CYNCS|nr:protein of unknown function DUF862, eukaryotic [Cynara cardunculus var. scolymus]